MGTAAPTGWVTALVGKAPPALGVDTTTGRACVATLGSGTVSVLNDQTGIVLHSVVVGKTGSLLRIISHA